MEIASSVICKNVLRESYGLYSKPFLCAFKRYVYIEFKIMLYFELNSPQRGMPFHNSVLNYSVFAL